MSADVSAAGIIHASAVALDSARAVLILGPSGAGKSVLALRLMALGARLVADDRVCLCPQHAQAIGDVTSGDAATGDAATGAVLIASAPEAIRGQIEARGIGILAADTLPSARIVLVVDLAQSEPDRLPPVRECTIGGVVLPLVYGAGCGHLDVSVLQWLKGLGQHGAVGGGRLA